MKHFHFSTNQRS